MSADSREHNESLTQPFLEETDPSPELAYQPDEGGQESGLLGEEASSELLRGDSGDLLPPERSMLSRQASMSNLLAAPDGQRQRRCLKLSFCQKASTWFTATILLGTLAAIGFILVAFPSPYSNGAPSSRSGSAVAVLSAGATASQRVVVWSGRAQAGHLYHDIYSLSLPDLSWERDKEGGGGDAEPQPEAVHQRRQWRRQLREQHPGVPWLAGKHRPKPDQLPHGRWKAAATPLGDLGMLVHGGHVPGGNSTYLGDAWLLAPEGLRWHPARYEGNTSGSSGGLPSAPSARRSHSLVSYQGGDGRHTLVLFGGRSGDGLLQSDVWRGEVQWPNISWTLVRDPQSGVGAGPSPLPRSGHAAAMVNSTHMLIHGGRSEVYGSFTDVWLFSLHDSRWQLLPPATAAQPAPRDFHAAVFYDGKLLIFGGRYGTITEASRPLGDRWLFDLATRTWTMLPVRGLSPLPRFLFAHTQYTPADGTTADRLLVFGGETGSGCKLNDVWQIDLVTHRWEELSLASFATHKCKQLFG